MTNTAPLEPYARLFTRPVEDVAADLESYAQLLQKWQLVQNLVSRETLNNLWSRHFVDSLQVLKLLKSGDADFLDLGSGGGFPALPLAIALKGGPQHFTMVEPNSRKVSFLRTVCRELSLNADSLLIRSEEIVPGTRPFPQIITSRALAPLPQLCSWMTPFFGPETRAILHKGREHVVEIAETVPFWDFDVLLTQSDTDPNSVLLTLTNLRGRTVS